MVQFVAAGGIFQAEGIVIGFNHPSAVILDRLPDCPAVDGYKTPLCHFQVSLEAKGGQQIDGPAGCGLRLRVTGKLLFKESDDLSPAPLLPLGLLGVIA